MAVVVVVVVVRGLVLVAWHAFYTTALLVVLGRKCVH